MKETIANKIEAVIDYMTQDIIKNIREEEESVEILQDKETFAEGYFSELSEILWDRHIFANMLQEIRARVLKQLKK